MHGTGIHHRLSDRPPELPECAWFCLRSQPRHEHIAAGHLRQMTDVEVFNPRVRFTRSTRTGPVVVTESMFPNYLFARFRWREALNRVHYAPGVRGIVHFGSKWPTVPEAAITELRTELGTEEVRVLPETLVAGEIVEISGGALHGLGAVVTRVLPGRNRVLLLLDFLGRQTSIEVGLSAIVRNGLGR